MKSDGKYYNKKEQPNLIDDTAMKTADATKPMIARNKIS